MEIRLLGSLEVRDDDGRLLSLAGPRLQKLLIALALRCGEVVSDDHLIEAVWGDDIPARSLNALQRQVSTLRRTLGAADVIQRRGTGYALALDKPAIDIFRFESLAARGHEAMRSGDVGHARELLDQASALWRGDALADVAYEEFAQVEIARLNEARLVATEARIDADLALGREAGLISELEQLVQAHPLREHLRAQLMLALTRAGRQADALRSYQSARAVLGEELGLEPSPELRALESAILQQDETVVRPDATASPGPRTNLRTPLTTLIGRRDDLNALRPVLHAQRLVTLVGPGGVGKSRLAIEAARESLDSDPIDVWLVELADVAESDGVVAAIMAALDLSRTGSAPADARRLIEFLKGRRALLVLDNCEHVIASTARITQDLLESCASLRIWATSREGLAIPGEVLWPVPPLSLDDAVALFIERGRAADPIADLDADFEPTHSALADICTRLDGLPLAIELAAARLRAMPVSEVAAGLEDRFRLLNRGARTARPRQQTLRAVVDWSYDLLFDDERRVFDRLSVFGGSCTSAAARVVCADDQITGDDVAELVTRLADKSLVTVETDEVDGYPRFRMLQTLVDYGRECLEISGEAERVHVAHVRYYADFAVRSLAALQGEKQRAGCARSRPTLPTCAPRSMRRCATATPRPRRASPVAWAGIGGSPGARSKVRNGSPSPPAVTEKSGTSRGRGCWHGPPSRARPVSCGGSNLRSHCRAVSNVRPDGSPTRRPTCCVPKRSRSTARPEYRTSSRGWRLRSRSHTGRASIMFGPVSCSPTPSACSLRSSRNRECARCWRSSRLDAPSSRAGTPKPRRRSG